MLRREGWCVNTKRVYRLYREEALQARTRKQVTSAACHQYSDEHTYGEIDLPVLGPFSTTNVKTRAMSQVAFA